MSGRIRNESSFASPSCKTSEKEPKLRMMKTENKMKATNNVQLTGYAGANPEIVALKNDRYKKATIRLATNEAYKKDGEWYNITTWHKVVAWNNVATKLMESVQKGSRISLTGRMNYRKVDSPTGKFTISEVVVKKFDLVSNK